MQTALVTGAGSGLGEAISRTLAGDGYQVIVTDVREEQAKRVAQDIGERAVSLCLDVRDPIQVERGITDVASRFERIDVLINNAGVDKTAPSEDISPAEWDHILDVNLSGPFLMARQCLPIMKRQGAGSIVNVVSTAARRAWANASAYHASKWGLLGLSHAMHVEARPHGVKVTALLAGGMRTPFLLERFPELDGSTLPDPYQVARVISQFLTLSPETVIPELLVIPMKEESWP